MKKVEEAEGALVVGDMRNDMSETRDVHWERFETSIKAAIGELTKMLAGEQKRLSDLTEHRTSLYKRMFGEHRDLRFPEFTGDSVSEEERQKNAELVSNIEDVIRLKEEHVRWLKEYRDSIAKAVTREK